MVARNRIQPWTSGDVQPMDCSSPMANACDDREERGVLWYLVWCHEKGCKEETTEIRDTLERVVHDMGGKFFCVKKAKAYSAWRARVGGRAPHVLLTDWREIKPCMQHMAHDDPPTWNRPRLIAVLAEEQKLFQRVREWTKTLRATGGSGKVDIIRGVDDLCALLAKVSPELGHSSWLGSPFAAGQGTGPAHPGPRKGREAAGARYAPFVSSVVARGLPPPVVKVFSSISSAWQSAATVERILKLAAMDQQYED